MTSASELFANRRSRFGSRNANPSLISPNPHLDDADSNSISSDLRRHHRQLHRRRRHDNGCDSPRISHAGPRRIFEAEHELLRSDHNNPTDSIIGGGGGGGSGGGSNGGTVSSRAHRLTLLGSGQRNDQLPTDVLQARARLLERLHGVSLTGNRQNITSSRISRDELDVNNNHRSMYSDEWEIETLREWIESDIQFADVDEIMEFPILSWKKPPGLSSHKIGSLPQENFEVAEGSSGDSGSSLECSICLEMFWEGHRLFRLPCQHRFHSACLEPWLRICGDCPYCRASI